MDQKSDVEHRAEKLYKNSKGKFGYLIREVVSNAIHAVIIKNRTKNGESYSPRVSFFVEWAKDDCLITVKDNGDGFNEANRRYFTHLDSRNIEKEKYNFHSKGQGKLAIVFFADQASYTSINKNKIGDFKTLSFCYPEQSTSLFDIEGNEGIDTEDQETGTTLEIKISRPNTFGRAKTFFSKQSDVDKLDNWFIENFFPFFMENESLLLSISLNGMSKTINKKYIEDNVTGVPFKAHINDIPTEFKVWLLPKSDVSKSKNTITCFARHLKADLESSKIEYDIDLPEAYDWFLTSDYFDENVDQKGDRIEIDSIDIDKIQSALSWALDSHFAIQIEKNRRATKSNIKCAKEKYNSLAVFMGGEKEYESKRILKESDIVGTAIEHKGRIEKSYWTSDNTKDDDVEKLLNSSLHIYISHRQKILTKFHELIKKYDEDGGRKSELEDDIHDLFLRRGETLRGATDINHLHNLWILDDKYTIFSETKQATSSRRGQAASDIYMWTDDPEKTRELLILELKSTSASHNAGDKHESMVAQVKRYAAQFYKDPQKILNWDVSPNQILYTGIILARKSDVRKELNSNNSGGVPKRIPFLPSSYYFNEQFSISAANSEPTFKEIRIEMYAYEDIYDLASARNSTFFRLLKGEFNLKTDE